MASGDVLSLRPVSRHVSPSRVKSLSGKRSLGESSDADGWFKQHNTEVPDYNMACIYDSSPFFIDDGRTTLAVPTNQRRDADNDTRSSIDPKMGLSQLDTDYVSAETFRDIVDDLTVQIGSLKRQLRRDPKAKSLIPESRKPFEIKVHSLKADEKYELEKILHKFVNGLPKRNGSQDMASRSGHLLATGESCNAMSPQISALDIRSPYASNSAPVSRFSPSASDLKQRAIPGPSRSKQTRMQPDATYAGSCVFSREKSESMATRTKKKLVVDRLEQLFAGENVFSGPKLQALQQLETSHEVVQVEYSVTQAWKQQTISETVCAVRTSSRETEILTTATTTEQMETTLRPRASHLIDPKLEEDMLLTPDLEPSQLVAENVRYVRQMGLPPIDSGTADLPADEYEWFYLNLLVNMAELHTMNVTRDFIRKAVSELSGHYIISTDGQKVRWKTRRTLASRKRRHDGDLSQDVIAEASVANGKRLKATHAIDPPTSLQTDLRPERAPLPWIEY
jgi:hypothetical protein